MERINYVISGWIGPRRDDPIPGPHYVKHHLEQLKEVDHNLSMITVVLPYCLEDRYNRRWIHHLERQETVGETPLHVIRRKNWGLSYGSWSDAYLRFLNRFDYYIFIEDDYVFAKDNFDEEMIDMFESVENCGYLAARLGHTRKDNILHATTSNGITKSDRLKAVHEKYGQLPFHVGPNPYHRTGQVRWTAVYPELGYQLADFTHKYRSPFYDFQSESVVEYAEEQKEYLMKPMQMVYSRESCGC